MILLLPSQSTVLHAYAVLLGMTPGNAAFKDHQAYIASSTNAGYLSAVESYFAGTSTATLASSALTNLGLTSVFTQADAEAFLNANPGNRAGALVAAGQWLYSYSGTDAVTLAAKAAYVNAIESSYSYSNNAVNVNGKAWVGTGGQSIYLAPGFDNLVGSASDDTISGFVQQNQNGANVNSFSTGDTIDGGQGTDTVVATLINDRIVESGTKLDVNVKTTNVENARFEVLDEGVVVDAGNMDSVKQFWSVNSDDSGLRLEDVRLGSKLSVTKDITFGMKDVDYESDLIAMFDSASLKNAGTNTSNSQILIEVGYEDKPSDVDNTNPTKDLFLKISFSHGGKAFDSGFLNTSKTAGAFPDTYAGLRDLLKSTLTAQGFGSLVVEFGNDLTSVTTGAGIKPLQVTAKQIYIKDPAGSAFSAVTSSAGAESSDPTSDVASRITPIDPSTSTTLIESNLILDNAGRGSTAGDVMIGAMSNSNAGVEKINVMVDRSSAIESLGSTNNKLVEIAITSPYTTKGDLEIGRITDTTGITTATDSGLNLIDASAFQGANLMLGTTVEAGRTGTDTPENNVDLATLAGHATTLVTTGAVDNLKTLSANVGANVTFIGSTTEADGIDTDQAYSYTTGSGADTINFRLDGDSVDAEGEMFTLTTNGGADKVLMQMDAAQTGVSQSTMALKKGLWVDVKSDMKIDTGSGADAVNIDSYGNFNITTGDDSDFVRINSVDENGNATQGMLTLGNASGTQNWGNDPLTAVGPLDFNDYRVLYQAKLTVTYAGLESTVAVNTSAASNFIASQLTINTAVKAAIAANPELSKLIAATDVTGTEQLRIVSLVGGDNDLLIDIFQPKLIATGTAANSGEVVIAAGDVTALRQGIMMTDRFDLSTTYVGNSDLLENEAEIADQLDNAGEAFYGSINQFGQGNEDNAYSLNLNSTEKTGTALVTSGAYAYLNDANGGQAFGTNATVDVNFSTVNLGNGNNDLLVVHSNDLSMNTVVIDGVFGKDTIVNFHDVSPNMASTDKNNVGLHQLDYTKLLTNMTDDSIATGSNTNNNDSALPVAITLHDAGNTFTTNVTAQNNSVAEANSVNVLHFNENVATSVKFADFTAAQLKDKLNDQAAAVTTVVGGLDHTSLTIAEKGVTLIGTTQHHIFMVENVKNLGEYKVFKATSELDGTDKTKLVNSDVDDFATVDFLGTLDFGYSINFNLVGDATSRILLNDLIDATDNVANTATVQGAAVSVATTENGGVYVPPVIPTYSLTPVTATVNEGTAQTFTLATTNVANGTVLNYAITGTGVTTADTTVALTGTVTVNNNAATLALTPTADVATEGTETAVVTLTSAGATVAAAALTITDTSLTAAAGTAAVAVTAGNTAPGHDATAAATTYTLSAGTYTYNISGFNTGDVLTMFAGAAVSVVPDADNADGLQSINFADAATGGTVTVSLIGLTAAQDAGLFNQGSINTVFGAGTLV